MRWFLNVLKALGVLLLLLLVLAYLLPDHRTVSRSREIAATPEQIWPHVVDPRRWSAWSPWYAKDPAMKLSYTGAASGTGAQWSWESSTQGQGSMRFERAEAPRLLAYSLRFEDMASVATGEVRLEPTGSGSTRVEWTFETRLGANPLMRWFGLGLDTLVGKDFEAGLARLAQVVARP